MLKRKLLMGPGVVTRDKDDQIKKAEDVPYSLEKLIVKIEKNDS